MRQWKGKAGAGVVAAAVMALAAGCGGGGTTYADGSISGVVMTTRPVANASVRIWEVDDSGRLGDAPVAETTTDGAGKFSVDIGTAYGALLIEANGGHSEELVSGDNFDLNKTDRLAAAVPDVKPNAHLDGLMVTPLTTMAEALGNARLACSTSKSPACAGKPFPMSFPDAQTEAAKLIGGHFGGVDPVMTQPANPTVQMGATPTEPVRYGLVLAGLSELSKEIAGDSGVGQGVVNTMSVTKALVTDLSSEEARFNGKGPGMKAIAIGSCPASSGPTVCNIDARTVRGELADAMDTFVSSSANVTGLTSSDIATITQAIAKDDNPKLFDGGPGNSAPIAFDPSNFYVDTTVTPNLWWTDTTGPVVSGTVTPMAGDSVTVTVSVGMQSFPATMTGNTWQVQLPGGTLEAAPASNMVTAVSEDAAGNKAMAEQDFRVDTTPATVTFETTTVRDELGDTIAFQIPPMHDHSMDQVVTLADGSGACPTVHKHATLMDSTSGDSNPIHFAFQVADTDSGVSESSIQYRIRDRQTGDWLMASWVSPAASEIKAIPGGYQADVTLYRDTNFAALATFTGKLDFAVRATDHLGQGPGATSPETTCWDNAPLGGPLLSSNAQSLTTSGASLTLGDYKIEDNKLAPLIDGTTPDQGGAVMSYDVKNYNTEPVYFLAGFTQPHVTGSRSWVQGSASTTQTVNYTCSGLIDPKCATTDPFASDSGSDNNLSSDALLDAVRVDNVTDPANPQPVPTCSGCTEANEYKIRAAAPGGTPTVYRVFVVATDLSIVHPGNTDTGNYTNFTINTTNVTGRDFGTATRCSPGHITMIGTNLVCGQFTIYHGYLALTAASLTFDEIDGSVKTSSVADGPAYAQTSQQPLPETNLTWATQALSTP